MIRLNMLLFGLLLAGAVPGRAQPIRNLVFEGGGIRGIAYVGALEVLEKQQLTGTIENTAGTSVGAITGCLFALGYKAGEMKNVMEHLRIQTFNDGRWIFFGGFARTASRFGWYRGDALEHWIGRYIRQKTGSEHTTFRQLHELHVRDPSYRDLYVTATNLSRQQVTVFSYERFPDMELATAVRASMSVPLYFSAVFLDSTGHRIRRSENNGHADVYVDGGILANYPLSIFDDRYPAKQTLGLKLERPEQITQYRSSSVLAPYRIDNFRQYIAAFYNIVLEGLNKPADHAEEASRTIYISTGGISPRVRKISREEKESLYGNGRAAALSFLGTR